MQVCVSVMYEIWNIWSKMEETNEEDRLVGKKTLKMRRYRDNVKKDPERYEKSKKKDNQRKREEWEKKNKEKRNNEAVADRKSVV